jgi:hypothetical protein
MQITRRQFHGHLVRGGLALAVAGTSLSLEGCPISISGVLTAIENWVPIGLDAIDTILTLLGPIGTPYLAIIALVKAGFAQLVLDIKAYQAITPPPVGALAKIEATLNVIVTNFQSFLSSINVPDSALLTTILGFAEVILSTIAGFVQQIGATSAKLSVTVARQITISGHPVTVTPNTTTLTRGSFKKAWNHVAIDNGHPEAQIKLTFWERF